MHMESSQKINKKVNTNSKGKHWISVSLNYPQTSSSPLQVVHSAVFSYFSFQIQFKKVQVTWPSMLCVCVYVCGGVGVGIYTRVYRHVEIRG